MHHQYNHHHILLGTIFSVQGILLCHLYRRDSPQWSGFPSDPDHTSHTVRMTKGLPYNRNEVKFISRLNLCFGYTSCKPLKITISLSFWKTKPYLRLSVGTYKNLLYSFVLAFGSKCRRRYYCISLLPTSVFLLSMEVSF